MQYIVLRLRSGNCSDLGGPLGRSSTWRPLTVPTYTCNFPGKASQHLHLGSGVLGPTRGAGGRSKCKARSALIIAIRTISDRGSRIPYPNTHHYVSNHGKSIVFPRQLTRATIQSPRVWKKLYTPQRGAVETGCNDLYEVIYQFAT